MITKVSDLCCKQIIKIIQKMRSQLVILAIILFAAISQADGDVRCACSDLVLQAECNSNGISCKWADNVCSHLACDSRLIPVCYGTDNVVQTNGCVIFNGKCQDQKNTCAEYTSDTAIQLLGCMVFAKTEGMCVVDTTDNKKCMKPGGATGTTSGFEATQCKQFTAQGLCAFGYKRASATDTPTSCYWDETKAGGDAAPKCLDMPVDCSVQLEGACKATGCIWKASKCEAKTCANQNFCSGFTTTSGTRKYCETVNGVCTEVDPSSLTEATCHSKTGGAYHFDGSCVQCSSDATIPVISAIIAIVFAAMI